MRVGRAAYVGILEEGTTSRMRAVALRELMPAADWQWVDTAVPFRQAGRLWRSMAFRWKAGRAVRKINRSVVQELAGESFDLIWVDKGVFLERETVGMLRRLARCLVHFTPDCAFEANRSRHFERTLGMYDLLVTTKSFELEEYARRVARERVHLTTQGYDAQVHYPREGSRRKGAVFVGLCEPDRERCMEALLEAGVPVRLGGRGWEGFVRRRGGDALLEYLGPAVFGEAYAGELSGSWVGLGLISKRFPELHTTRTFEIPACGAVLATERNAETSGFFTQEEAIFFADYAELGRLLSRLLSAGNEDELMRVATAGRRRVEADGRSNVRILQAALEDALRGDQPSVMSHESI